MGNKKRTEPKNSPLTLVNLTYLCPDKEVEVIIKDFNFYHYGENDAVLRIECIACHGHHELL